MQQMVKDYIRTCATCQKYKVGGRNNCGLIILTTAMRDKIPWEKLLVDCAGPWTVRVKLNNDKLWNSKYTSVLCLIPTLVW